MKFDKDIISKIIFTTIFVLISFRVLIPIFLDRLKGKKLGINENTNDIDQIINRKKNLFRTQFGGGSTSIQQNSRQSETLKKFNKELSWGGQKINDEIASFFKTNFSYSPSENRLSQTIRELKENNSFQDYINEQNSETFSISLSISILFKFLIDEIIQKDFNLISSLSKKFFLNPEILAISIQMEILKNLDKNLDDEKIYSPQLILKQFSEKSLLSSMFKILSKTNSKNALSSLIEVLSPSMLVAELLCPFPELKNKNDLETARKIIGVDHNSDKDKMKARYKKLAQMYHPDKISPKKLPKQVEKMANIKFKQIQSAWDIINNE